MKQKAILAFSGGLDTSVVVKYLQEKHNMDVVTVTVDVGQEDDYKKNSATVSYTHLTLPTILLV